MNKREIARSIILAMVLAWSALLMPDRAVAETRYVTTSIAACSALLPAPCYTSIQSAINDSVTGDAIEIKPGTYSGNITMPSSLTADLSLTVRGTETATTIIAGGGSGTLLTASNSSTLYTLTVTIRKLTFKSAAVGISASQNVNLTVTNSIFSSLTSSAINLSVTTSPNITNNTFYQNGTAISRTTTSMSIVNNIFFGNTAVSSDRSSSGFSNNCYHNNQDSSLTRETSAVIGDPLFVDPAGGDYHLKTGSPCINAGAASVGSDLVDNTNADIGTYGGPTMDTIPFPVSALVVKDTDTTDTSIPIEWTPNNCYLTTGYKIYYGKTSGIYGTPDTNTNPNHIISGLTPDPQPTPVEDPNLQSRPAGSGAITLQWDTAAVATAYEIRYNLQSSPPASPPILPNPSDIVLDYVATGSVTIGGLTDFTWYRFQVTPFAQQKYYIAVKAYYVTPIGEFESAHSSEVTAYAGPKEYGTVSEKDDYPEPITAYPNLPNTGCFIATAAYGYYSAPQVQVLRDFRDRYLLTNTPGRVFVRWYYSVGPVGARFLNEHSWLKPAVRVALLPAVGGAYFMTRTAAPIQVATFAMIMLSGAWFIRRRLGRIHGNY